MLAKASSIEPFDWTQGSLVATLRKTMVVDYSSGGQLRHSWRHENSLKGALIDGLRNLFWILLPEDNVYFTYIAK